MKKFNPEWIIHIAIITKLRKHLKENITESMSGIGLGQHLNYNTKNTINKRID